jgi:hypothetical protein
MASLSEGEKASDGSHEKIVTLNRPPHRAGFSILHVWSHLLEFSRASIADTLHLRVVDLKDFSGGRRGAKSAHLWTLDDVLVTHHDGDEASAWRRPRYVHASLSGGSREIGSKHTSGTGGVTFEEQGRSLGHLLAQLCCGFVSCHFMKLDSKVAASKTLEIKRRFFHVCQAAFFENVVRARWLLKAADAHRPTLDALAALETGWLSSELGSVAFDVAVPDGLCSHVRAPKREELFADLSDPLHGSESGELLRRSAIAAVKGRLRRVTARTRKDAATGRLLVALKHLVGVLEEDAVPPKRTKKTAPPSSIVGGEKVGDEETKGDVTKLEPEERALDQDVERKVAAATRAHTALTTVEAKLEAEESTGKKKEDLLKKVGAARVRHLDAVVAAVEAQSALLAHLLLRHRRSDMKHPESDRLFVYGAQRWDLGSVAANAEKILDRYVKLAQVNLDRATKAKEELVRLKKDADIADLWKSGRVALGKAKKLYLKLVACKEAYEHDES